MRSAAPAALSALCAIYHAYGCKTVEPKPVIKLLPKAFGHADKNVRAEASNLTAEFYRWLKDAMKPLFWGELKPVQQADLEKMFDKVKATNIIFFEKTNVKDQSLISIPTSPFIFH